MTARTPLAALAGEYDKDSVVFYVGIKDAVPEDLGKDKIDGIIREEMTHITILSRELAAQDGPA